MRNCFLDAMVGYQHSAKFAVGLRMTWIEFQLPCQLRKRVVCIAMFPIKVTEPEVYVGEIRSRRSNGKILRECFVIFFAVGIKLAEELMYVIRIWRCSKQTGNLIRGDLTPRKNQLIACGKITGMNCQPAKKRCLGGVKVMLVQRILRLGKSIDRRP